MQLSQVHSDEDDDEDDDEGDDDEFDTTTISSDASLGQPHMLHECCSTLAFLAPHIEHPQGIIQNCATDGPTKRSFNAFNGLINNDMIHC